MSDQSFKKLKKIRDLKVKQEAEKLLNSNANNKIESNLEWIEVSSKLLSYKTGKRLFGFIPVSILVMVVCLLLASLGFIIKRSEINLHMQTVSTLVGFTLSENWSLAEPFTTDYLRINNFQALSVSELGIPFNDQSGNSIMEIFGKNIVIEKLGLESKGIIELDYSSNHLTISIKETKIRGAFSVKKIILLKSMGVKNITIKNKEFEYPEYIEFTADWSKVPTEIIFNPKVPENKRSLKLANLKTNRFKFLKEIASINGEISFVSTVIEGEIKVYDVPIVEKIYENDIISMEYFEQKRIEISCKDDIRLLLQGKIKNLKIGPKGFEKQISPTWLEYLYHNEKFVFFCSAFISLWGIFWGIKEALFNKC